MSHLEPRGGGALIAAANEVDIRRRDRRAAAQTLLARVVAAHHRLELVWADGGYTGSLIEYGLTALALVIAVVKRSDDMRGFVVLPKRWIVERSSPT